MCINILCRSCSSFHPRGQGSAAVAPRLHVPVEEQPRARTQAVVLFLAADVALPRRREHGGPRGSRAHRAFPIRPQPRAAERAPVRGRSVRGAHAASERAPRTRAARPPPSAPAAAACARAVRGDGARDRLCVGGRGCRRRAAARRAAPLLPSLSPPAPAPPHQPGQAAPRRYTLQGGRLDCIHTHKLNATSTLNSYIRHVFDYSIFTKAFWQTEVISIIII